MTTLAKDVLNSGDTFLLSLVSQHSTLNNITDSIDVWLLRLPMIVCLDDAAFVGFDSCLLKLETASESVPTNRDESNVALHVNQFTSLVFQLDLDSLFLVVNTADDGVLEKKLQAQLFERILEGQSYLLVNEWANTIGKLNNVHLGTQNRIDRTKLKADNATTDDYHSLGDSLE